MPINITINLTHITYKKVSVTMITSSQTSTLKSTETSMLSNNKTNGQTSRNFNNFLQLLTTELKYQDPLKPLDPTQTVTQLATFSTVEQAVHTNELLNKLIESTSSIQAASMVGRTISTDKGQKIGIIKSLTFESSSPIAILESGERVSINPNMIIS